MLFYSMISDCLFQLINRHLMALGSLLSTSRHYMYWDTLQHQVLIGWMNDSKM